MREAAPGDAGPAYVWEARARADLACGHLVSVLDDWAPSSRYLERELLLLSASRIARFRNSLLIMTSTILVVQMISGILSPTATSQAPVWFIVGAYAISLAYLGILWRSHDLAIRRLHRIDNQAVWVTLYLLAWLGLLPFATAWLVATRGPEVPVVVACFSGPSRTKRPSRFLTSPSNRKL
jgi:uncharacterized membrane protein YhaH (DUF805 family)